MAERRKAEGPTKESEERLHLVQTCANIGIWNWDIVADDLHWSGQLERLYGLTPGAVGLSKIISYFNVDQLAMDP